ISLGKVKLSLDQFTSAEKLKFCISIKGTDYENDWDIWVYPSKQLTATDSSKIYYCHKLDNKAKSILKKGGKVFILAAGKLQKGKDISMHFTPVFWNTSWFRMRPPH